MSDQVFFWLTGAMLAAAVLLFVFSDLWWLLVGVTWFTVACSFAAGALGLGVGLAVHRRVRGQRRFR